MMNINRIVIKAEKGEVRNENDSYLQLILRNGNRYEELIASTLLKNKNILILEHHLMSTF